MRFALPPTADEPGELHVIIESFRQNQREVFAEVKGVFRNAEIGGASLGVAESNIERVRAFVRKGVGSFLRQYDAAEEAN